MTENPSLLPQIPRSQRPSKISFADSPSRFNPFGSGQVSPAQRTSLLDHESPQNDTSPKHYLGHRPSKSFTPFALDVKSTKVSPQQKLDNKTLESLDKLFDIKNARIRASIMNSRRSINIASVETEDPAEESDSADEETAPASKVISPERNNGQAMISKVKVFIGHKGLEVMTKSRQFDENLAIFNQVKTFVDIRKVIKETADANSSPLLKSTTLPTEHTESTTSIPKETARNPPTESTNNTLNPDSSFKISRDPSNVNTPNKSKKRISQLDKRGSTFGGGSLEVLYPILGRKASARKPSIDIHLSLPPSKPAVPKEMTAEELREQEIRKLYIQLKENAIKKFGPEIFDNIQHKLNNPKHIKEVTKKRREELKALRNTKKELGNFDLGGNLVNYLSTQERQGHDDEDSPKKFIENLKTNPEEEESDVYQQLNEQTSYPIATWTQEVNKINKKNAGTKVLKGLMNPLWIPKNGNTMVFPQEDEEERPEDDPQIKMFQQIEEYKKKSDQIIKAMTNKASKAFKEEVVVPGNIPNITRPMEKRNTHDFSTTMSTMDFPSQFAKKKAQTSFITAGPFEFEKKLHNKNRTLVRSVITEKNEFPSPKHGQLHSISPSRDDNKRVKKLKEITQALSVGFLTPIVQSPKAQSTVNSYRDKFDDLCMKMDRVENDNKMINSNLKASFKQMEDPFRRQSRALNNFETPESLLNSKPKSYKSTSKLAISLASKSIKDMKLK